MRQFMRAAFAELRNRYFCRKRPGASRQIMRVMFGAILGAICFTAPLSDSVTRTPNLVAAFAVAGAVIALIIGFACDLASANEFS